MSPIFPKKKKFIRTVIKTQEIVQVVEADDLTDGSPVDAGKPFNAGKVSQSVISEEFHTTEEWREMTAVELALMKVPSSNVRSAGALDRW